MTKNNVKRQSMIIKQHKADRIGSPVYKIRFDVMLQVMYQVMYVPGFPVSFKFAVSCRFAGFV